MKTFYVSLSYLLCEFGMCKSSEDKEEKERCEILQPKTLKYDGANMFLSVYVCATSQSDVKVTTQ